MEGEVGGGGGVHDTCSRDPAPSLDVVGWVWGVGWYVVMCCGDV